MIAQQASQMRQASQARYKLYALLEVLFVYALIQTLILYLGSTSLAKWEKQNLGWSYMVPLICFVVIPALIIWLTHRNWTEYGVSLANWRTNLDIGIKALVIRIIPDAIGRGGGAMLGLNAQTRDLLINVMWVIAIAVMIWVLNRHRPVSSGRNNLVLTAVFLLLPIFVGLTMQKLTVVVVSTIVWQFLLSGFGEEFAFRGYFQSRLNQAFGRPLRLFGIQFGVGLILASLLFGLLHAFNGFIPDIGFASLDWGSAIGSAVAGLFFGVIREKTGTLFAPGIAHGLPDALGEPLMKMFGWVLY
jgi:membrane protease YdiL (CAAX protease family)